MLSAALLWLTVARELWMFVLFGVVFGFSYGSIIALQSLLTVKLFGLSSLGVILGSVSFIYTVGGAVGPFLAGYIFDITNSYNLAFIICVAASIIAVILTLVLKPIAHD